MALRGLTVSDVDAVEQFVVLASFAPGRIPERATERGNVRRWLADWPGARDVAIGEEEDGCLVGVALARVVEPVLLDDASGVPVPEVLVAVEEARRGRGLGSQLVAGLIEAASARGWPALALTVSQRNPAAVATYRRAGFTEARRASGLLVMTLRLDPASE